MAGWIVGVVLALGAVLAVPLVRANRRHGRHEAEVWWPVIHDDPEPFYGAMWLDDELAVHHDWLPAPVNPEPWAPDWREQTAANLSPEALDDEGLDDLDRHIRFPDDSGGWASGPCLPGDPGPGELSSCAPGPAPDLSGGPTVRDPEGATGVNAPSAQPADLGPRARAVLERYEGRLGARKWALA